MKRYTYVIVGASIAGLSAAKGIRSRDPRGGVLLVHGEDHLPYRRTQLSKQLVRGFSGDELAIYPREWYPANGIELLPGVRGISVDPSLRELSLSSGEVVGYEALLLTTGALPATLTIPGSRHLQYLRDIDQAERIMHRLRKVRRAVSIGFGVQGIELADQFASAGIETTLVGREDQLMNDHLDAAGSARLHQRVVAAGVSVVRSSRIVEMRQRGRGYRVVAEGTDIDTDMACASVGAVPTVDLAVSAGLSIEKDGRRGVKVQQDMRTDVEGVFAAGDAAAPLAGASWGLWHSAEAAGMTAGANMAGGDERPRPRPYRLKCEAFGGYLFSLNYLGASSDDRAQPILLRNTPALYLRVWEREGRSVGALLDVHPDPESRGKALGKRLAQLVDEGARTRDIPEALGI